MSENIKEFRTAKQLNLEKWKELVREEVGKETLKHGIMVWIDEEDEVWWLSTEMEVSRCVGLLEMAKHFVIGTHVDEE